VIGPATGRRTALLALGANLGDPVAQLRTAVSQLRAQLTDVQVSKMYRTAPEGGADQPDYVNAVVRGLWHGTARELLSLALELEQSAGRTRPFPGSSRTLDVDVLFLGELVVEEPELRLPHPRWATRAFVVVPLLDVAPDWIDPVSGKPVADVARERAWHSGMLEEAVAPSGRPVPLETP